MVMTAALGGAAGLVIAHQGEDETDERLVGSGLGALTGAALGSWLCKEGGAVSIQTAQIRANPQSGEAPLDVALTAQLGDPDTKARYEWDLGDGTRANGPRVLHTYAKADSFDVRLTVTDADGKTTFATTRIDAQSPLAQVSARSAPPTQRRMILRGINFAFDSAAVTSAESSVLDAAIEELQANPTTRVRIEGDTDSVGTETYNQALSERRAEAVFAHMVANGIDRERLETAGRGERNPLTGNETADGRAQNRRVELDMIE
jgi:outer membrane protein OmpA-like peptidoglycan-associated protein